MSAMQAMWKGPHDTIDGRLIFVSFERCCQIGNCGWPQLVRQWCVVSYIGKFVAKHVHQRAPLSTSLPQPRTPLQNTMPKVGKHIGRERAANMANHMARAPSIDRDMVMLAFNIGGRNGCIGQCFNFRPLIQSCENNN